MAHSFRDFEAQGDTDVNNLAQDNIQRELEQRALRNVRGLVDKMEDIEALDARRQRRYLAGIIIGALVVLLLMAGGLWIIGERGKSNAFVIDSSKSSPPAAPH